MLKLKFYMIDKNYTEAEKIARELYSYRGTTYDLMEKGKYREIFNKYNAGIRKVVFPVFRRLNALFSKRSVKTGRKVSSLPGMNVIYVLVVRSSFA